MGILKAFFALAAFAALATLPLSASANQPAASFDGSTCLTCHSDIVEKAYSHYPANQGLCNFCHSAKPEHLETGDKDAVTTSTSPKLTCYNCHDTVEGRPNKHNGLKIWDKCANCHNPHASDNERYLKENVKDTCLGCHKSKEHELKDGKSMHGVINGERSCMSCHLPHSSELDKLLLDEPQKLCLGCHDKKIESGERVIPNIKEKIDSAVSHKPAVDNCLICHDSHATPFPNLLIAAFPKETREQYNPGDKFFPDDKKNPNTYAVCFIRCHQNERPQHSPAMLEEQISASDTAFRNDSKDKKGRLVRKNLHWSHVSHGGWPGRSCKICHDPHGTTQVHLLRNNPWGFKGRVKLQFEPLPEGGNCVTCHAGSVNNPDPTGKLKPKPYKRMN